MTLIAANIGRIALGIAAALGLLILAALAYRFVQLPREAARSKAEAIAARETASAISGAAQDGFRTVIEVGREGALIDATTRSNDLAITTAAGADSRAPAVAAALHDSLCRRSAYRGDPGCVALRRDGGEFRSSRPDAGRGTPTE